MKGKILSLMVFGFVLFGAVFTSAQASEETIFSVNVLETEISISVPDRIIFNDIAAGYLSEDQGFELINSGTTDIQVTPSLDTNYNGTIFKNLKFDTVKTNPEMTKIGVFNVEVSRPTIPGGVREQQMYAWLDLTQYSEEINETMENHEATVIFTATQK